MNKTTEALKLAEEALIKTISGCKAMGWTTIEQEKALAVIREELAEPDWKEEAMRLAGLNAKHVGEIKQLKSEPVCEHGVDDGACKECYMEAVAEPDMNLNCKSVQARLATVWGYVKAEQQKPMAIIEKEAGFETEVYATGYADSLPDGVFKLYAAPVRTKDLTDTELMDCRSSDPAGGSWLESARAVIAADREKNRG